MKPGTTAIVSLRAAPAFAVDERTHAAPREPCRGGDVGSGAAVMPVGRDDLRGIDVRCTPARPRECRGEDRRRHALPPGDEQVARAWGEVPEHANRDAQLAVLARRAVNRREQPSPGGARRDERAGDVTMAAQEDGRGTCRVGAPPRRRRRRAVQQEVGHAGER